MMSDTAIQDTPSSAPITTNVFVVGKKSVGAAFLLSFLFGPLGMLYSTVVGGLVMLVLSSIVFVVTFGFGVLLTWPICIVWAVLAASSYNRSMSASTRTAQV